VTGTDTRVDVREMTEKYERERDKRLRADGTAQYRELSYRGELARYLDDPVHPGTTPREPVVRTIDVLVIGTGLSGIICAAELAKAGVTDILQIDSAGGFGGTWYWNRYPGVRCDTESYIYMPLLEDTGTVPTEQYASGEEIRAQFERVARMYGLDRKALFQTRVTSMRWDEDACRWVVETDRGDRLEARFVIPATGRTHRLKLPGIPGIEEFTGHSFHTGRWDYAYTAGGPTGNLENLRDKRVAIIGTGATAIQCIPYLAEDCRELYVIQRTPTAVAERSFRPTAPEFADRLEPGWQLRRSLAFESLVNFEAMLKNVTHSEEMTDEGWSSVWGFPKIEGDPGPEEFARILTEYDIETMERIRRRIDSIVEDPATAEALKPYYYRFCKRPTFSRSYYEAFNRPNVHLVDTEGRGADEITERGIVVGGRLYEVDCIIYATGQEVGAAPPRAGEFSVIGRDGVHLEELWTTPESVESLHGIHAHGFPNLILAGMLYHSAAAVNLTLPLTEQARHVATITSEWLRSGVVAVEATREAQQRYGQLLDELAPPDNPSCTPGYYNSEGKGTAIFRLVYGGNVIEYNEMLRKWRSAWETDMTVTYAGSSLIT